MSSPPVEEISSLDAATTPVTAVPDAPYPRGWEADVVAADGDGGDAGVFVAGGGRTVPELYRLALLALPLYDPPYRDMLDMLLRDGVL